MVDLAKIRKKAKKAPGSAGVPPAAAEASSPPPPPHGGGDAAIAAGGDAGAPLDKLERFKENAGKRRGITTTQVEQAPTDQLELLTFTIAGEHYAVDIERIVEIVTPRPVTRIPNADESVVGIISLRGTIVTLVDVRKKLRHPQGTETPDTRIVVIDFHKETVGFVVDRVLRVVKLARAGVEPHPVVHTNELEESIRGVFRTGGALTILLDLDKLLDHSHGSDL
ncbi:MAG TPA: chemotaxis protein CheW [Thermoanaerobaculia bacterium]